MKIALATLAYEGWLIKVKHGDLKMWFRHCCTYLIMMFCTKKENNYESLVQF